MIIRNIPEDKKYEDKLLEIVQLLIQKIQYTKPVNICSVQRIGTVVDGEAKQQNRPVVVKFASKSEMIDVLSVKKKVTINCSQILYGNEPIGTADQVIFFDERLTKLNSDLYYHARLLRKNGHVKYAWMRNGIVYVRKSENSSAVRIVEIQQCKSLEKKRKLNSTRNDNSDGPSDYEDELMDTSAITSPAAKLARDETVPIAKRKPGRKCKENKKKTEGGAAAQKK